MRRQRKPLNSAFFFRAARLVLLAVLALGRPAFAEPAELLREDGTSIVYHLDRPRASRYPLAVILQGSECLRVTDKYAPLVAQLNAAGIAVLRVEKPGLKADTPIGECPEEYLRLNTIERRVLDLLAVIGRLRRQEPGWDGRLGLSGGSEGSMVAAIGAPLLPETETLLLLSSGGGSCFGDEVKASIAASIKASGASDAQVDERLAAVDKEWEAIMSSPLPTLEWGSDGKLARNTYLWWSQALPKALFHPLLELEVPIRVYQGKSDTSVLEANSRLLEQRFREAGKGNLEVVLYEGEHVAPPEVLEDAFGWLADQLE